MLAFGSSKSAIPVIAQEQLHEDVRPKGSKLEPRAVKGIFLGSRILLGLLRRPTALTPRPTTTPSGGPTVTFLAVAAAQDLELGSLDVEGAFLKGVLPPGTYIELPAYSREFLSAAPAGNGPVTVHVLVYVDDVLVASKTMGGVHQGVGAVLSEFKGNDLGEPNAFLGLHLGGTGDYTLKGWCDADWAGDVDSRRSTTGYIFTLGSGAITKHIDVKLHFVRERAAAGDLELRYTPTAEMLADPLTKAVSEATLVKMKAYWGLR